MELEPYLSFNGNCEEALNFYKGVFGGEITSLNRFEGSPMESEVADKSKIMHSNFVAPGVKFMASDGMQDAATEGSRITLSLGTRDVAEAERVFNGLSAGGKIDMPLQDTFWGATFGMLTDKYGIDWMVNCELPQ
jgi:PhnB protein